MNKDCTAATDQLRSTVKTALAALLVFALLSLNTCDNIKARETWDDIYAWLLLKRFAASLPMDTNETVDIRRLGMGLYCLENDPLYREADPEGLLKYASKCPYEGELIRTKGTYTGWYQQEFWLEPVYPEPLRLRVFLYRNIHSSLFWGSEKIISKFTTVYEGYKFELLDPRVMIEDQKDDEIVKDYSTLPFNDYVIARYNNPSDHYFVLRRYSWEHYMNIGINPFVRIDPTDDEPLSWTKAQVLLTRQGITPDVEMLSLADPEILKALAKAYDNPADVQIAGFNLPGGPFLMVFSLLFMMIALGSRAATRELARAVDGQPIDTGPWVFAAPRAPSFAGKLIERILILTSLAIAVAPILCFLIQCGLGIWPGTFWGWLLGALNGLAAVASALLLIDMFVTLASIRQAEC